jgi:hypothetical protein
VIGMGFGEDQRENIIKTHVSKRIIRLQLSNNYYALNSEHNWENLCIQSEHQQTRASDKPQLNRGKSDFQTVEFADISS